MNMEQLQKENDELRAHVERLCEWANCLALTTHERWGKMVEILQETPAKSLRHIESRVEEETIDKHAKDIATEFFYHWYNAEGSNTAQGFDDWWEINRERFMPRKYKEQSYED